MAKEVSISIIEPKAMSENDKSSSDSKGQESTRLLSLKKRVCHKERYKNEEEQIIREMSAHCCTYQCAQQFPLHYAAKKGNYLKLQELLNDHENLDPTQKDTCFHRTPLHYACETANVKKGLVCVRTLLTSSALLHTENEGEDIQEKVKEYVNEKDFRGQTALLLAGKNEATEIVTELIKYQASFCTGERGPCILKVVFNKTPDAMEDVMNGSITFRDYCVCTKEISKVKQSCKYYYSISRKTSACLDFYPIIAKKSLALDESGLNQVIPNQDSFEDDLFSTSSSESQSFSRWRQESAFLYSISRNNMGSKARKKIFSNPLVQAFLYFKWRKMKMACTTLILFQIFWLLLYIYLIIEIFVIRCHYASRGKDNNLIDQYGNQCYLSSLTKSMVLILIVITGFIFIMELFQFKRLRLLYINFENIGQCALIGLIFTGVPGVVTKDKVSSLDFQLGAFGMFLAWTLVLVETAKFSQFRIHIESLGIKIKLPDHGIYIQILSKVFKNFLIFMSIFSCLLVAFVFSFSILLPDVNGFGTFWGSFVKVLTMMTGELNYEEMFFDNQSTLSFPASSQLMYVIFIVVATIILLNLLIGFTVSDIQGLQKDAELNQTINKLEQIFLMESFLFSKTGQMIVKLWAKLTSTNQRDLMNSLLVISSDQKRFTFHTELADLPPQQRCHIKYIASKNCFVLSRLCGSRSDKMLPSDSMPEPKAMI